MERSHLKSPIEDSRRFALFGNRQWLCGENLMENTVVLSLTDQNSGHSKPCAYILNILHLFGVREIFQWSKVTTSINNLILEKLYCDHCSTMRIQGNHNYSCKLKFKEQSIIDQNPHQLLWKRSKPPQFPTRYNLPRFAITMNELTLGLKLKSQLAFRKQEILLRLGKLEKHMWMQRGWGLSRKSSYGEILLRLTYKAYVEDEE
ncbi:hypothetical protein FEM48_Zijuj03G0029100 [Ziziphus jujuba var. spinosa]|uniref:Uncharacterized protein n=1 Tax=Ziziphus jujuba var. spinosa TaxID=714518 RepID=A0A978VMR6_ZIZJJ|nr:hypothetical protein FEM48_Zijuj03G0029100 [Ziziphus jujuba var. spinosa]